jgi:drug/metabolite transporter (DMT)-like permease
MNYFPAHNTSDGLDRWSAVMKTWLILGAAYLVMGGQFAVAKLGLAAGLTAHDLVALRFVFAAAALAPVLFARGWDGLKNAAGIGWGRALLLALIAGSPYALLLFGALNFVPAGHGAMIIPGTTVVLGTVLGALWLGENHPRRRYVGAALVLAGIILTGAHSLQGGAESGHAWLGDAMFLAAGLEWALFTLLVKRWKLDPLIATAVLSVISLLYLAPYFLLFEPRILQVPLSAVLLQGLYQGLLQSVFAMVGYAYAVKKLGAAPVAVGVATVPVIGTLLAMALTAEVPALLTWAGLAAVSAGMVVANWPVARAALTGGAGNTPVVRLP